MHPPNPEESATELSAQPLVSPLGDPPNTSDSAQGKSTILLVEDDENSRFILSLRLDRDGYHVISVADGSQALHQLSTTPVDLVILDIMMPGMNGLEVLYVIRSRYTPTQLPVIMMTALSSNDDIVGAFTMGANDYITKPINYAVTKARIQAQLSQSFAYRHLADPTTTLLGGRYRIQKHLSQGGFGDISSVFAYPTLNQRLKCGLPKHWLLVSQAGQPLSPPRALFRLHVMTHRRVLNFLFKYSSRLSAVSHQGVSTV